MDVSIVIPVHDEGRLICETVDSILAQEAAIHVLPSLEILIVKDNVTDRATLSALDEVEIGARGVVRVLENRRGSGPGGARNSGILAARGEWIAFLDGDDLWTPRSLAERWTAGASYPSAGWVGADFIYWTPGQPTLSTGSLGSNPGTRQLLSKAFATGLPTLMPKPAESFLRYVLCWTGTVMARRDLLIRVGLFDETLRRAQDVHLWYRLAASADYLFVPQVLGLYRQRPSTLERRGHSLRGPHNRALKSLLADPLLVPWRGEIRAKLGSTLLEEAEYLRSQEDFTGAFGASIASLRYAPGQRRAWRSAAAAILRRRV